MGRNEKGPVGHHHTRQGESVFYGESKHRDHCRDKECHTFKFKERKIGSTTDVHKILRTSWNTLSVFAVTLVAGSLYLSSRDDSDRPLIILLSACNSNFLTKPGLAPHAVWIILASIPTFLKVHLGSGTCATFDKVTVSAAHPESLALRMTMVPRAAAFCSLSNGVGRRKSRNPSKLRMRSRTESQLRWRLR
jgi:hypothetical protein